MSCVVVVPMDFTNGDGALLEDAVNISNSGAQATGYGAQASAQLAESVEESQDVVCSAPSTTLAVSTQESVHSSLGLCEEPVQRGLDDSEIVSLQTVTTPARIIHGCTLCAKTFSRHTNLVRHVRKQHPGHSVARSTRNVTTSNGRLDADEDDVRLMNDEPQLTDLSAHVECVAVSDTCAVPEATAAAGSHACVLCGEVFFNAQLLDLHLAHHARLPVSGEPSGVVGTSAASARALGNYTPPPTELSSSVSAIGIDCAPPLFPAVATPDSDSLLSSRADDTVADSTPAPLAASGRDSPAATGHQQDAAAAAANPTLQCEHCSGRFKDPDSLAEHSRKCGQTPLEKHTHRCGMCSESFPLKASLEQHKTGSHGPFRFYECTICSKSFKDKHDFRRHERIHSGERPFKCPTCNKSFSQASNLEKHRRIHSDDKPHECDVCGKSFIERAKLQRHLRTHSGEQPYQCLVCQRFFSQKHHLRTHMLIHTGEKPHACDVCGKQFRDQKDLVRHRRLHTGEKPYGCGECSMRFRLRALLTKHRRSAHTEPVLTSMVTEGLVVTIPAADDTPSSSSSAASGV
eukprot:scpid62829/ scgid32621/ Zinc finger protein 587